MHDAGNPSGVTDIIEMLEEIEADEKIAGKEGFCDPKLLFGGDTKIPDSRTKDVQIRQSAENLRRYMIVLRLGSHTIPLIFFHRSTLLSGLLIAKTKEMLAA
jgi:hypothetical protein